ncbi:MAG: glycosyl transferase, family 2 [Fibrobacteres bacterium]|nr:glycosyl transferase, family 2 [Fibrobacterota bacterium]
MSLQSAMANEARDRVKSPDSKPLVSLGLPVYNGENFLREALDSVLAQTYPAWELIISDNGSTDATEAICREYAAREPRIRYYREAVNHGATWNFNRVFTYAEGPLFRWTAHDDVCAPELLEQCVAVMQDRPEVVLCYPRTLIIDPVGEVICEYGTRLRTSSPDTGVRFDDLINVDHACFSIFGVIRTRLLRRTGLMGDFVGSDRNLLAELALYGPFHEIPGFLFLRRDHPGTSTRQFPSAKDRRVWFNANHSGGNYPTLTRAIGYWKSIARVPLGPKDRLICLVILGKWTAMRMRSMLNRTVPHLGRLDPLSSSRPLPIPGSPEPVPGSRPASTVSTTLKRVFTLATSIL